MIMEEELSISLDGKNLANLRVVDLKQELEKRGLSKSGSKKDLIKRLKQQLEFEKLCEERKSTGDCELKKELDAATEQNEFVQRYLAQQQKIFAEQKEMKRLVELEESQKKSDTEECIISPKIDENLSSSDEDTEHEIGSGSESNTGERALKVAIEEISSRKKNVGKETVKDESGETPSSDNVTTERHIIKIERDKVYTIISNKNQNICTDVKSGDDKNSSNDISNKVSSEKECSMIGLKHENQAFSLIKNKQATEEHVGKANKNHSVIEDTENICLDNKHNQRDISFCEEDKDIIICNTNKNTSKIESKCKVVKSNFNDKNKDKFLKIDTDKSVLKCEDTITNSLKIEDANESAIKIENTGISALKIQDTEKSVSSKTENNALLTDESIDKSTLKTEHTDKSDSSKIENTEETPFKIEDTVIRALRKDTNRNTSLKNDEGECALKNEAMSECALKNEDTSECTLKSKDKGKDASKDDRNESILSKVAGTGESALLKNENLAECLLKNKDIGGNTSLEKEDTGERTPKQEDSDESIVLKNEDISASALKNAVTGKSVSSKNEDTDKSAFLNVENIDITTVKTDLENCKNQITPDCQLLVVRQSKSDLCSANSEKKTEDVSNIVNQTQGKADKQFVEIERNSGGTISYAEQSKVSETSNLNSPCQTSSSCKQNVQLSPSSEPVPDSNIYIVHPSTESFEINIANTSSENKLVSMDSAVPYSLSDIQLPDSPSNIVKPAIKATSKKESLPPHPTNDSDKDSHSDNDMHRNGLNSASKSHSKTKSVLDDTSNKRKTLVMEPKRPDHQNTVSKRSLKVSDIVIESAFQQKSKQSKNKKIFDSEEKTSKKVEEKSFQSVDKYPESHTNSSSGEESSGSNSNRKRRQHRSKISGKHSKIPKPRSRSSSSSSRSSQSQERIPEKLSKNVKKKPIEPDAPRIVKKHHTESSNRKILKSKPRASSSSSRSSQSRETSPIELSKKVVIKSVMPDASGIVKKSHTERSCDQKASKSRSNSPSSSQNRKSAKPSMGNAKKSIELDLSKLTKIHHSKNISDQKTSKSSSRSPTGSRSSHSRERSPVKSPKEDVKKLSVSDAPKIVRKRHFSPDQKTSKSRSRSPTCSQSSKSRKKSPLKQSEEDVKKQVGSDSSMVRKHHNSSSDQQTSKSRSHSPTGSRNSRERSPVKPPKEDIKKLLEPDTSHHTECSSDKKTSKNRSCSPSSSQERSLVKPPIEGIRSSVVPDTSTIVRKYHRGSSSDQKASKSRSRSPSSSQSRERSPVKLSKEVKNSIVPEASKIIKKHRTGSVSDKKTSKSRSRSPPCSQSQERSPLKASKDNVKKLAVTEASRTRKRHSVQNTSKSRSCSPSSSRSSQSQERSPKKSSKEDADESAMSNATRTGTKHQTESSSDQKTSKRRSRSFSSSPPPNQALELFFSGSKKKRSVQASKEIFKDVTKSLKTDVSGTVEQKSDISCDAPRKKLKINRNNVVISSIESSDKVTANEQRKISTKSFSEKTSKVSPSSVKKEKERRDSASSTQLETVEREMGEIIENSPEVKYEPRKINFPGRKLSRKSSEDQSSCEPKSKKSKWGKFASSQKSSQAINISSDSLKNWFPEFKLVSEPSVVNDSIPEESPPIKEEKKLSFPLKTEEESTKQSAANASHQNNDGPLLETTDSSGPISKIVFIQNLVRPFTLLQLKELLRQTGSFIEDDFWIDKIKSKCFVTYTTEEEAVKTRNALNGVRWPSSNPKILSAEFSTEVEFEHHRSGKDAQKPTVERLPEVHETYEEKASQPVNDHRRKDRDGDKRKERERFRPQAPVREWDKDKVLQDSPDREKPDKNIEGFRGSDKKDKKDAKKRTNEDTPAKLLDDLFQKTKSPPCIYWLPLTEAQVLEHEESKRLRRLEREKRNQQREKEESEQRNKRSRLDHRSREVENRRSSTRSRSPTSRRR